MATGNGGSLLRPGVGIARTIRPGSLRLMAILAQRVGTLCNDASATIQERPRLMLGLLTALVGSVGITWLANRLPRRQTLRLRLRHGRRQFKAALDLPPLASKLLANPIVQDYLRRTVLRAVSRKLGR
jgi:hypothetical protein